MAKVLKDFLTKLHFVETNVIKEIQRPETQSYRKSLWTIFGSILSYTFDTTMLQDVEDELSPKRTVCSCSIVRSSIWVIICGHIPPYNVQSHKTVNICPPVNIRTCVVGYPVPDCKTIHPQIFTEGGEQNKVLLINHKWSCSYWLPQALWNNWVGLDKHTETDAYK